MASFCPPNDGFRDKKLVTLEIIKPTDIPHIIQTHFLTPLASAKKKYLFSQNIKNTKKTRQDMGWDGLNEIKEWK